MSRHFSFVVFAPSEVELPEQRLILDKGMNAFNILVEDLDSFKALLEAESVRIDQVNPLDDFEPVSPQPEALLHDVQPPILRGGNDHEE